MNQCCRGAVGPKCFRDERLNISAVLHHRDARLAVDHQFLPKYPRGTKAGPYHLGTSKTRGTARLAPEVKWDSGFCEGAW